MPGEGQVEDEEEEEEEAEDEAPKVPPWQVAGEGEGLILRGESGAVPSPRPPHLALRELQHHCLRAESPFEPRMSAWRAAGSEPASDCPVRAQGMDQRPGL